MQTMSVAGAVVVIVRSIADSRVPPVGKCGELVVRRAVQAMGVVCVSRALILNVNRVARSRSRCMLPTVILLATVSPAIDPTGPKHYTPAYIPVEAPYGYLYQPGFDASRLPWPPPVSIARGPAT